MVNERMDRQEKEGEDLNEGQEREIERGGERDGIVMDRKGHGSEEKATFTSPFALDESTFNFGSKFLFRRELLNPG